MSFDAYVNSALPSEATRALLMARNCAETVLYSFAYDVAVLDAHRLQAKAPLANGGWRDLSSEDPDALAAAFVSAMERHADFDFLDSDFEDLGYSTQSEPAAFESLFPAERLVEAIRKPACARPDAPHDDAETDALDRFGVELVRGAFNPTVRQAALFAPDAPTGEAERAAFARRPGMADKLRFLTRYFCELTLTNIHRMLSATPYLKLTVPAQAGWVELCDACGGDVASALRGRDGAFMRALGAPSVFDEYGLEPPSVDAPAGSGAGIGAS